MAKAFSSVIQKLPIATRGVIVQAQPKLQTFMKYAKVELVPPKVSELPQVMEGFRNLMRSAKHRTWKNMPVREAWLNTLIGIEIACWFYVGECIGKRSLLGYQV